MNVVEMQAGESRDYPRQMLSSEGAGSYQRYRDVVQKGFRFQSGFPTIAQNISMNRHVMTSEPCHRSGPQLLEIEDRDDKTCAANETFRHKRVQELSEASTANSAQHGNECLVPFPTPH
ncbi:MAG: hypothetical protein MK102_02475 [Fuerstiella sp.]|nr:hypothetical protein [Fuerstiella sp.]